jgi:glycolate oxidase FAD binding subunit
MLVRAPSEVRAAIDVFEPQGPAIHRLSLGIKMAFDPARILNPGRMYAGV